MRFELRLRRSTCCSAPAARCDARCRVLGDAFFVLYGDSLSRVRLSGRRAGLRRERTAGLMTVFRNDDRWDRSNVAVRRRRIVRYDKARSEPEHAPHRLRARRADARARCAPYPVGQPFDLAAVYQDLLAAGDLGGVRSDRALLRDRIARRLEETRRDILAGRAARIDCT